MVNLTELLSNIIKDVGNKHAERVEFVISHGGPLEDWLDAAALCTTMQQVMRLVDKFRPGDWTDEQRAQMSRAYMLKIDRIKNTVL